MKLLLTGVSHKTAPVEVREMLAFRDDMLPAALAAFMFGSVFHFVSIIEEGIVNHRCPINNFYETLSMCTFLVALVYLLVHWRYKLESLSVFLFPLVFVILFLSSAFFPHGLLQEPAKTIAHLNPLSLIADGMRGPVVDGVKAAYIVKALGGIAIVAGFGCALTALTLRRRVRTG